MNITTLLKLNIPIFFGGLAGIALAIGQPIIGWGLFIVGAVIQNHFYTRGA
jgi:hypothetical protein